MQLIINSPSSVTINWTNNEPNPYSLYLDRATDLLFTQNVVSEVLSMGTTTFTDTTLTAGTIYFYRLRTVNASGTSYSIVVSNLGVGLPNYSQGTPFICTLRIALLLIWSKWPYRLIEDQNGNLYTARQLINNQNMGTKALMQVMVEYCPELGTIVWVFGGVRQVVLYTVTNQTQNPMFTYL